MESILKYFSDFTPAQMAQFQQLQELYTHWNPQINVISRKDIDALYQKHVLHSLSIAAVCNFKAGARVLDIGTGGGFPGIPLAIFFPKVEFLLCDSIGKKIKVVQEVATALGLKNVEAKHVRAETLPQQSFDFVVSRAVAPLKDIWQWARPLIRKGHASEEYSNGLICLKGGDLAQEIFESELRPHSTPISQLFDEAVFEDKYILYSPKR